MSTTPPRYEEDFYAWTQHQAALLRARKWQEVDATHLAEEIDGLGRGDRRELEQRLETLLIQLLTWWAKPEDRCGRWASQILSQRHKVALLLDDSPSLQAQVEALLTAVYPAARIHVLDELGLVHLPTQCPFAPADVLQEEFWPESATL
jgi:hypothetical protein